MAIPKVVGIETEYGFAVRGGHAALDAGRDFLRGILADPAVRSVPWSAADDIPARDARGTQWLTVGPDESGKPGNAAGRAPGHSALDIRIENDLGVLLPNGARLYLDHAHPEYCTPECLTARELVAHDKAGEAFLLEALERYNDGRTHDQQVLLFKNNSDHQGHSYGCHENYLLAAGAYADLFGNKAHRLYAYLLPYLVTRQIFCGAGKVGSETDAQSAHFQLSQRAEFFVQVIGLQTMNDRPFINTRDEPHADPDRFRRLHVICGDANLAPWSNYLKIAITQLVLAMLEDDALRQGKDLMLADPVQAARVISADPMLAATVELEQGRGKTTAIAMQRVFLEAAQAYLETDPANAERWGQVYADWRDVLGKLETAPEALDRRLDWRIKWQFMKEQLARRDVAWQHPIARELDMRFHQLDRQNGFYYLLHAAGFVEDLVTEDEIRLAMAQPPDSTRAYLRGSLVRQDPSRITTANWAALTLDLGNATRSRFVRLSLPDPCLPNRGSAGDLPADSAALADWLSATAGVRLVSYDSCREENHARTLAATTPTIGHASPT